MAFGRRGRNLAGGLSHVSAWGSVWGRPRPYDLTGVYLLLNWVGRRVTDRRGAFPIDGVDRWLGRLSHWPQCASGWMRRAKSSQRSRGCHRVPRLQPKSIHDIDGFVGSSGNRTHALQLWTERGIGPALETVLGFPGHHVSISENAGVLTGDRRVPAEVYGPIQLVGYSITQMHGAGPEFLIR